MKLLMTDLDGTLVDTKMVNFLSYQEAVKNYGYTLKYDYYCKHCNGKYYLDFLPQITTDDLFVLNAIHQKKKEAYNNYLKFARLNQALIDLIVMAKPTCKIALVTTASNQNTHDILDFFEIGHLFDLILTHEHCKHPKPDPEGYLTAMRFFNVPANEAIIFEDSKVGIEAGLQSGASVFIVTGYN